MPQVILVRLVPMKPTSGADFSSYLTNLSIRAFDLSFGNSADGTLVGQAQGAWIPNAGLNASGPAFTPATQRIVQHFSSYQVNPAPPPNVFDVRLEAVATAIIELNPPATEFNTTDLRLEIKQGTQLVAYERLDFNVKVEPNAPISNDPLTYISVDPPAVIVTMPVYIFPEAVAKTLSQIDIYRRWLERPKGKYKNFSVDKKGVQEIIDRAVKRGDKAIIGREALEILTRYGIPSSLYEIASTDKEAVALADKVGYPVVLKINTPQILHKTEFGAVVVDLRTAKEVRDTFVALKKKVAALKKSEKFSVVVQAMVTGGVETVIGMTTDPSFGPLIMFGLGGIYVEILKDVAFRINPLSDFDVDEMIRNLKSYPLLTGFRGSMPIDLNTLKETLLRLSQLVLGF